MDSVINNNIINMEQQQYSEMTQQALTQKRKINEVEEEGPSQDLFTSPKQKISALLKKCKTQAVLTTLKNLKDLKLGHRYPILSLKLINSKFGKSVNATLEDIGGGQTKVFLPKSIKLDESECAEYEERGMHLIYKGMVKKSYDIDFE